MVRLFAHSTVGASKDFQRNNLCRLANPIMIAEVSSHLRNFAVAEVTGFIAMLDGHPELIGEPTVTVCGAAFQQVGGTIANPLAHAIPSNMLLNGKSLVDLYHSARAKNALQRVFGMGVMAPDDWAENAFPHQPRQNNTVDTITERHRFGDGLVDAFKACGEAAVGKGRWNGDGKRRYDLGSLTKFIEGVYESIWVPRARKSYLSARSHFAAQIMQARNSSVQRMEVLEQRRDILEAQIRIFEREANIAAEAAKNVMKATSDETWN